MIAGIILDPRHEEIYTANNDIEDTVVVMPYTVSGDVKPGRVFSVPHQAWGLALSEENDQIAVTVEVQNTIVFYRRQVQGVEAPVRIIRGRATGLADPHGIYWDESHNEIGVANHGNFRGVVSNAGGGCTPSFVVEDQAEAGESLPPSIRIFSATAKDDAKPLRVIEGPKSGLDRPMGVAYDPPHDTIAVANNGDSSILIFDRNSSGDVRPLRIIFLAQMWRGFWRSNGDVTSGRQACASAIVATVRYFQGISEAWITSGTPCPPTDLIARSTSLRSNV
jgi:DNA-binding beta-propeller fold protein YncE